MKKIIRTVLFITVLGTAMVSGCQRQEYDEWYVNFLNHADRDPICYNHDYLTVAEVFSHVGDLAEGDTVMLWGYRKNCCDLEFDVWQSTYLHYVPLILCTSPVDTLPGRDFQSNFRDCIKIHLQDIDTADYIENHTTSDIWKVIACVHFEIHEDDPYSNDLYCICHNNYISIPQQP